MEPRITDERIAAGQVQLKNNAKILAKVEETYGVAPESLMAFWGLETNYGGYMGDFGVFDALATLAWDERRAEFFRAELLDALEIVEEGHIWPEAMVGSWAGAMGHFQFLPSTFLAYAVDFDGDGRKDIWINTTDAFASAANFLVKSGWKAVVPWGYEVVMPKNFPWEQSGADNRQPVAHWQQLGVRLPGGGNLTQSQEKGAILLPAGWQGPAFVVLNNFFTTLRWNNSHLYAISVGHLADRIAGKGPFKAKPPAEEERLSREEIEEMQGYLNALGYDTGKPDGKVGPMTRKALRAFQMANGYPADAYPTRAIIAAMKTMAG
jgi:membrane-bound lytic murein transglycosylase B